MSLVKIALLATLVTLATVAFHSSQSRTQNLSEESLFSEDLLSSEFQAWRVQYNKTYGGAEETKRFTIFKNNKIVIAAHENNNPNRTYTLGLNKFSDLTQEEFSAIYLGFRAEQVPKTTYTTSHNPSTVSKNPEAVDWREKAVNAVKNQGQCGSCWAFSAVAALEGLQAITEGHLVPLSEQQLVDCSTANNGCNGGLMNAAYDYTVYRGIASEADYAYTGVDGKCKEDDIRSFFHNSDYTIVASNKYKQLEEAVAQQVVSVAISAGNVAFQHYTGGVIDTVSCGTALDHGVAVVGYTADAWIVRNSWGANWGEKGYVRIAKGDQLNGAGICGINQYVSYPTA